MRTQVKEFGKYGEKFSLIKCRGNAFLYERGSGGIKYYEVWRKRYGSQHPKSKSKLKIYKRPGEEDFGQWAWCFKSLDAAERKFVTIMREE